MSKHLLIAVSIMWVLTLPIVVLGVGFAGNRLWSPVALYEELASLQFEGIALRIGLFLYIVILPWISVRNWRRL